MKVTWNWLSEFVELTIPLEQLVDRLDMSGLEVESTEKLGSALKGVRVAQVVSVAPHPNAERLKVCTVRCAEIQAAVVCGAPNVAEGQRVAYAAPGADLPSGEIAAQEIRGFSSAGMLCSENELGLGPETSGVLILPADAPLGEQLSAYLRLDDTVIDVSVTPNRGDCLSVVGLAREIAALTGVRLQRPRVNVQETKAEEASQLIKIRIDDDDLCGRYVGRVVSGVQIGASPLWVQYRLRAVGMRPINNVVDATNYVMLERGQPLHAFDYDVLPEKKIVVRRAGDTRRFTTLDDQERVLSADDLLITTGGDAVAIAGIMGGRNSEVGERTKRILLESAWFSPATVRRTAKRLGLRTEASFRFERSVDIEGGPTAADRAASLIVQLAGGIVASGRVDVYPSAHNPAPIAVRLKRVEELLGMTITRGEVAARLKALGMSISPATRGTLTAVPPSYRTDLVREVDVIEEIVRLVGYNNVPATLPQSTIAGPGLGLDEIQQREVKRFLAAQGLTETVPPSFCSETLNRQFPGIGKTVEPVVVRNPLSQDEGQLRLSLCSSLVKMVRYNLDQSLGAVALFAIGKVFWRDEGFAEAKHLGGAVCSMFPTRGLRENRTASFADVKGILESLFEKLLIPNVGWVAAGLGEAFHPGFAAEIRVQDGKVGVLGALHPDLVESHGLRAPCWLFELDLDKLLQYCPPRTAFQELPRFPAVIRDLAILTDEDFVAEQVLQFVREWPPGVGLIHEVELFDQYVGEAIATGKKSLAYSIAYRAHNHTLTDEAVNQLHSRLKEALTESLKVQPR